MNDFLLSLSKNETASNVVKKLGLPIPLPQELRRPDQPRTNRPLDNKNVAIYMDPESELSDDLAETIAEAGANPYTASADQTEPFEDPAEAYGRPADVVDFDGDRSFRSLVFDATSFDDSNDIKELYDFFHPLLGRLETCGTILVVGRPTDSVEGAGRSALQESLQGFVRSLSKEIGRKGQRANLLQVKRGAEPTLAGPTRFLLSDYSTYVNGQALEVDGRAANDRDPSWQYPLENQVALITGSARGIGAETARTLAKEGADVICLDLPMDDGPVSKVAREIDGDVILKDITDDDAPQVIADRIKEEYGGLDILVNNAGITRDKTLKYMDEDYWDSIMEVNFRGVKRVTDKLVEDEILNDGGRIICTSSISGIAGNKGQTNYGASKAALIGFVNGYADELADSGITVNAIAPGFIETRLTEEMPVGVREVARRMNNLNQGGRPEDVGQTITFLATPGAQGVTGQVLRVCGGSIAGR
ncbi:MAG: 3-oxoacyl-ACP reductase [bacterium]